MSKTTIVFFGEDLFSDIVLNSLLDKQYSIPLVVSPLYNNLIYKRLQETCRKNNVEYIREQNINSNAVIEKVKEIRPDILITAHFEKLISKELLSIPKLGCLNLHPSILPDYRGMSPQHWPIINGDDKTGITIHFIDEGIDTGNIVLQKEISLNDQMYVYDLQMIWRQIYKTVMCEAVEKVVLGYKGEEQNKREGSYYGKLRPEQCKIDLSGSMFNAYNLIRGVSMPYQGAFIENEQGRIIIWKAEIYCDYPMTPTGIIENRQGNFYLSFNDGTLLIKKHEIKNN